MGLYAIWFPKNRILDSASYLLIHDLLRDWLGMKIRQPSTRPMFKKAADYTRIESKALGELVVMTNAILTVISCHDCRMFGESHG